MRHVEGKKADRKSKLMEALEDLENYREDILAELESDEDEDEDKDEDEDNAA